MRAGLLGLLLAGCGARGALPAPRYGEHPVPVEQWQEVETPPPAIEVEEVGAPRPGRVWIDGQWVYQPITRRWVWEQGRWCAEPPGALFYARARFARERRAVLEDGEPQRLVRWNELQKRYEQVDIQSDHWRWIEGRFYVAGPGGGPTPWRGDLTCDTPDAEK